MKITIEDDMKIIGKRNELLKIIDQFNISSDLILSLNAIRACMKYSFQHPSGCIEYYISKLKKLDI